MASDVVARVQELVQNSVVPINVEPCWYTHYSNHLKRVEDCFYAKESSNGKNISIGITGVNKSILAKLLFNRLHTRYPASCILVNVREQANSTREGLVKLQSKLLKDLAKVDKKIQYIDEGRALLLAHLKNIRCFLVLDDIDMDKEQLGSLLALNKHQLGEGSLLVLTSRYRHVLHDWAQVDEILALGTETCESPLDNTNLAICYKTEDVHAGFVNHLKESFSMLGLTVSEMKGADLLRAFQQASSNIMYIVILSPSFMNLPDLLKELDEASRHQNTKLVYILYGMDKTSFQGSLHFRAGASTMGSLPKQLLRSLSRRAVYYSVDLDKPEKSKADVAFKALITDILSNHLRHSPRLSVTSFPVGLMERQRELESLLEDPTGENMVSIGIVGMGGLGKTTLIKSLYNKIHNKFEGSVLLLDVRQQAKDSDLLHLQKQILRNEVGKEQFKDFSSVAEGKELLSQRFFGTSTLVILDDVDDMQQLEALYLPMVLGSGSQVIITSRNRDVLKTHARVDKIYNMPYLSPESAKTLFSWHAFLQPDPPIDLKEISQQVIDACQGLPLSLQVIGAHVYGHADISFWQETLLHLRRNANDIFKTLRVSVDALERDLQKAFLDVACFLIGKPAETAVRVWKGCGWSALHYLEVLQNKSLINVDPQDGLIGMHDQLRDMGRYLVAEGSFKTHIWDMEGVEAISKGQSECFDHLRGLAWISQEGEHCSVNALLGRLSHLKLLLLHNVRFEGSFSNLHLNEIRWLQWHNSTLKVLPPELCSRALRVLDLSGSICLQALWRHPEMDEMPKELLELNLSGCEELEELPQFDRFLCHLEWLSLHGCKSLNHIHNTINSLTKLKFLDLGGCVGLQSLPGELQGLCSLEKLLLPGCELLESLPEDVGRLQTLIEICLDSTSLRTLPSSIGQLKNLEKLSLSNCQYFRFLPDSVRGLEMLKICNLSGCTKLLKLPRTFCELVNLEDVNVGGCDIADLPENIANLKKLKSFQLNQNQELTGLPESVGNLSSLKFLRLDGCSLEVDGMPRKLELENLEELQMQHNNSFLQTPPSFTHLRSLSRLDMHHCANLTEVAFLPCSLRQVDISHCPKLKRISDLYPLKSLEILVLCECNVLEELVGLEGLKSLESLNISQCKSLHSLPGLQTGQQLQLSGSGVIPSMSLFEIPTLEHVTWFGSEMPEAFPDQCMVEKIDGVQYANKLVMKIEIPNSISRQSSFAILLWLISHDQGWSDYGDDYSSYIRSLTFIEGYLVRRGTRVAEQLLYRNRHADDRDQVHLLILRPESKLLVGAQRYDMLEIRARSLNRAWRITVRQASYRVVGLEDLQSCLQNISNWAETAVPRSQVVADRHSPVCYSDF